MILFCEECGGRSQVEMAVHILLKDGFCCEHCGFVTPPGALDCQLRKRGNPLSAKCSVISWIPSEIYFDSRDCETERGHQVVFTGKCGQDINMESWIIEELKDDIKVQILCDKIIEVSMISQKSAGPQCHEYSGPAVYCCDTLSDFWCKIPVYFNRLLPGGTPASD